MKVTNLHIENFLAIGEIEVSLADKGLVNVEGENKDDTSQDSNGSGKSSFPDALSWCFYGETARGESGDLVVNRTAGKNCRVKTTIEDDGIAYEIARHRKHSKEKNRLTVRRIHDNFDMTKGTDKATQEVVTKLIGCSLPVFVSAIYAGQEAIPDLPRMTDKQLKELVEEASGTTRLQKAFVIANARLNAVKAKTAVIDQKIDTNTRRISDLDVTRSTLQANSDAWEAGKTSRLADALKKAKDLKAEYDSMPLPSTDRPVFEATIKTCNDALSRDAASRAALRVLQQAEQKAQSALDAVERDLARFKSDAKILHGQFTGLSAQVGCPCGSCGKPYSEEDIAPAKVIAGKKVKDSIALVEKAKLILVDYREALGKAQDERAKSEASQTDVSATVAEKTKAEAAIKAISDYEKQVANKRTEYQNAVLEVKRTKDETNPHTSGIAKIDAQITVIDAEIIEANRDKAVFFKEIIALEDAAKVFSPAGVRAHILDTVTPFLNDRTAHYLSILSDGNLSAQWSTLNKLKSGEIREKFAIVVSSLTGGETFNLISGGEKRKVRLACSMALQDLVASRASKPFNLYIADEIDDAVDASGLERLMGILEAKARERGTVLVISHNSLSDWIRDSVKVVKSGGFATLEGGALAP